VASRIMSKIISAATLTYGERLNYLFQSVDRLLEQKFANIYIYCNGISLKNHQKIKGKYPSDNVVVLFSDVNLGSAGGYYELLQYVIKNDNSDYLLLLDDDNRIPQNCFDKINKLEINDDELFYFHRPDRMLPKIANDLKQPEYVIGTHNSFLGRDLFSKLFKSTKSYAGDIIAAPYGGLLLNKHALNTGALPKKELYLYADDYEYTYRLVTEFGFKILFSETILIEDLEKSFHLKKGNKFLTNRYSNANKNQLYYSVRNNTWLGLHRCESRLLYLLNLSFYSSLFILQFLLTFKFKKISIFISAIKDGFSFYFRDEKQ